MIITLSLLAISLYKHLENKTKQSKLLLALMVQRQLLANQTLLLAIQNEYSFYNVDQLDKMTRHKLSIYRKQHPSKSDEYILYQLYPHLWKEMRLEFLEDHQQDLLVFGDAEQVYDCMVTKEFDLLQK